MNANFLAPNFRGPLRAAILMLCALSAWLVAPAAMAQSGGYPERPIVLVVPFAPGAGTDAMGRLLGAKLAESLAQKVIIENRTGASGAIGARSVAQAAPDGYTLLLVVSPFTTTAASMSDAGYDPITQFAPIGLIATGPLVWAANNKVAAANMQELLAYARQNPGRVNYGSAGTGSVNHLALELLQARAGVYITHIPYRGIAPATTDMISGEIQLVTGTIPALLGHIREGRVKALAVTSAKRSPVLPEVPSMAESGLRGFDVLNYFGLVAPAGTPTSVIAKLNAELHRFVAQPDVVKRFANDALEAAAGTPAQLAQFIAADFESWRAMVKAQNLQIQ
jgi:tripartite-type tricarboxylate transporter receptor subunit TctC